MTTLPPPKITATIEYSLTVGGSTLKGRKMADSGRAVAGTTWYASKPEPKGSRYAGEFRHSQDAELLVLDYLAEQVLLSAKKAVEDAAEKARKQAEFMVADGFTLASGGKKGGQKKDEPAKKGDDEIYFEAAAEADGEVTITSDYGPCHSCRSVITKFREEFPGVTLKIVYKKPPGAPQIQAPDGMHGTYGYPDAKQGDKGFWTKTFE